MSADQFKFCAAKLVEINANSTFNVYVLWSCTDLGAALSNIHCVNLIEDDDS